MGADPGTLPESNMELAAGASLADPASWLDLPGAIDVANANRRTNGVAFVCGDGWSQARVTNPTDADAGRGVVSEPCTDNTGDWRVLLQHRIEDDEVNPRWPDEPRWTTIPNRLWAVPTLTLRGTPPDAAELIDLVQMKPGWLPVMAGYDGMSDTGKGDAAPVAAILFDTALENTERGAADSAYFIDTVQSAMVRIKVEPPTKRHLQTIYTARKNAIPPRVKEPSRVTKRRERAERQDGFVDDIQQAHGLADALMADGHKFQTDDGPDGRWLMRDERTGLMSRAAIKGKRGISPIAMSWVEAHAELLDLGNYSALARSRSLLDAASDLSRLHVQRQQLDQHPELIGTPDGVLDIRTGKIRKATDDEWMTRRTSHSPAATYRGSVFYEWLEQTVPDADERDLLQNLAGYTLQGVRDGKLFVVLHGVPGAAKSAFLRVMSELLGSGENGHYTAGTKRGIYANDSGECSVEYAVAAMEGFRLALFDELQPERTIDEDLLKSITGAANQSARSRFGHERNANITAALWMATNNLPKVRFGGDPMVVRARLFEWTRVLDRPHIHAELLADRPALFAWMLEGAQRYMREGTACLAPTTDMHDRAVRWLGEGAVNPMRRFVTERLEYVPGGWVFSKDLRHEWDLWRGNMTGGQRVDSPFNANQLAGVLMNTGFMTVGKNAPYPDPVRDGKKYQDGKQDRGWSNLMVRRDPSPAARPIPPF